ncbi:hypothetical protein EWM64_g268 [Hericium alpestre]|uniref:Uncharacterized protein n=1 Tax=Hericium alpestre TaxID=135208 RepID=A0A4Z0AD18_9AGAM|nr:hypothetical protein EWM64_g268 [Hericium alpestre]
MSIPDMSQLKLYDPGPTKSPHIPDDLEHATDRYLLKLKTYAQALPYSIESNSKMQEMLDFILTRIVQCLEAKDYDPGFLQWDSMLTYWSYLKYPIFKEKRMRLVELYYHVCTTPGMPLHVVATCSDALETLTSHTSYYMGYVASTVRRFYHPLAIDEMLATFVPMIDGTVFDNLLSAQYYLLTFLPQSHPQSYLPMLFRLWESVNSYMFDERMLQFLAELAEMHLDPSVSDPKSIQEIPDDARSEGEGRPNWPKKDLKDGGLWHGLFNDVGIFTEYDWHFLMCKCLASMEIPLADAGSLNTGPAADSQAGFELGRLPKPTWRIVSLARLIVYSMVPDSLPQAPSTAPTPFMTPMASGHNTPRPQNSSASDTLLHAYTKGRL